MNTKNWRDYLDRTLPGWLNTGFSQRLSGFAGLMADCAAEAGVEARKAAWIKYAAADGLGVIGSERQLPQYPGEPVETYRARLKAAWDTWRNAGNESVIIAQLQAMGFTGITIKSNADWNWDNDPTNWSRFWIVITGHPWVRLGTFGMLPQPLNGGRPYMYGQQKCLGITAPPDAIATLLEMVQRFKPAHVINPWIILVMPPATTLGTPDGTWDLWRNRDPNAVYINDSPVKVVKTVF